MNNLIDIHELIEDKSRTKIDLGMAGNLKIAFSHKNSHLIIYRYSVGYISQAVAAERAGIRGHDWMNIENNKTIPDYDQASKISALINKPISTVFPLGYRASPHRITLKHISKLGILRASKRITQRKLAYLVKEYLENSDSDLSNQFKRDFRDSLSIGQYVSIISKVEWNLKIRPHTEGIVVRAIAKVLDEELIDIVDF